MEIGSEMATIILHMRQSGQNTKANRRSLELLAESFLRRITGQGDESGSIDSIEIGNRRSGGASLTI